MWNFSTIVWHSICSANLNNSKSETKISTIFKALYVLKSKIFWSRKNPKNGLHGLQENLMNIYMTQNIYHVFLYYLEIGTHLHGNILIACNVGVTNPKWFYEYNYHLFYLDDKTFDESTEMHFFYFLMVSVQQAVRVLLNLIIFSKIV